MQEAQVPGSIRPTQSASVDRPRSIPLADVQVAALYAVKKDIVAGVPTNARRPTAETAAARRCPRTVASGTEAIRYGLSRRGGLMRFIDGGRIELANNTVEHSIRPIAAGSDGDSIGRWSAYLDTRT